jgi:hypothetical protein
MVNMMMYDMLLYLPKRAENEESILSGGTMGIFGVLVAWAFGLLVTYFVIYYAVKNAINDSQLNKRD